MNRDLVYELVIDEFPTHIERSDNKIAPNKKVKINNQLIYNQSISKFTRAIVVNNMHKFIINEINKQPKVHINYPVDIEYEMHTVINHGSISLRSNIIRWKPAKPDYKPSTDIDNMTGIWSKTGNDSLSLSGIIEDDNISIVKSVKSSFVEVSDIKHRKLVIKIYKCGSSNK